MEAVVDLLKDIRLLEEDVPGASLGCRWDGKPREPHELMVPELKRWLACRGARRSGNKAQLVERVTTYIAEGRAGEIVDPDHGANVTAKIEKLQRKGGTEHVHPNLAKVPKCPPADAPGWTSNLSKLPCFTFRTIYKHFAERSELEVDEGECGAPDDVTMQEGESESAMEGSSADAGQQPPPSVRKFRSFRGLDKGYRFFRDGHVQNIQMSPVIVCDDHTSVCYVTSTVLPSMRKDRTYKVRVCCTVPAGGADVPTDVRTAYCVCPAGLAGSCNHVAALLYGLEDFVRSGLREEAAKACTEKLKTWNRPRARKVKPRQVSEVFLVKQEYTKRDTKRLRITKPHYDPRPLSERLPVVNEVENLLEDLRAAHAELEASKPSLVRQYGSSSWLKLLEHTPAPSSPSSSSSEIDPGSSESEREDSTGEEQLPDTALHELRTAGAGYLSPEQFFEHEVAVSSEEATMLEEATRPQGAAAAWHKARRVRVTSTMAKAVACRRKADFTALVRGKLQPSMFRGSAMVYGCKHEGEAREAYLSLQQEEHAGLTCCLTGLIVKPDEPWLGASPDGLVTDPSSGHQPNGLLEIKCPYIARNGMSEHEYAASKPSCLSSSLQLKTSHQYFYQIQVAMHVCQRPWCDFVVWSPKFLVLNRVFRDDMFLSGVLTKLRSFYFTHLLPALSAESLVGADASVQS